jgi:hypothetical protein
MDSSFYSPGGAGAAADTDAYTLFRKINVSSTYEWVSPTSVGGSTSQYTQMRGGWAVPVQFAQPTSVSDIIIPIYDLNLSGTTPWGQPAINAGVTIQINLWETDDNGMPTNHLDVLQTQEKTVTGGGRETIVVPVNRYFEANKKYWLGFVHTFAAANKDLNPNSTYDIVEGEIVPGSTAQLFTPLAFSLAETNQYPFGAGLIISQGDEDNGQQVFTNSANVSYGPLYNYDDDTTARDLFTESPGGSWNPTYDFITDRSHDIKGTNNGYVFYFRANID